MSSESSSPINAHLQRARELVALGQVAEAERLFTRILELAPEQVEPRVFLAAQAFKRGEAARSVALLEAAVELQPDNTQLLTTLGQAYEATRRIDTAGEVFRRAVEVAPGNYVARLHLGALEEHAGKHRQALVQYVRAVSAARSQGRWRDQETTEPWLHTKVSHATRFVIEGRRALFSQVLAPFKARFGSEALKRVERCLATYLGEIPPEYADARQRPRSIFFPALPPHAYLPMELVPFLAQMANETDAIRAELAALLADGDHLVPFLTGPSSASPESSLRGTRGAPQWNAFFFYRHGQRFDENCARCPHTAALIDALPLVRVRGSAPEICFSVLTPGTHILPHRGVTNTRVVAHLPLIVPEDCALSVGGELHQWQPGKWVVFDDTFEHEAWNRSAETRVVLIVDLWNPYLTEIERECLSELVATIGEYNRECWGEETEEAS
jgi:aspartate beta-hydroxylase